MMKFFPRDSKKVLIGIMVLSVLLRVAMAFYFGNKVVELPGISDQVSYHNLALRVAGGHGFSFGEFWWPATRANEPTAHWSFLYTLLLAAFYAVVGNNPLVPRLVQAVAVGILMPLLTYRLAHRLLRVDPAKQEAVALVAAGITAVYIYFFYYAAALMTESLYILAILWLFNLLLEIQQTEKPTMLLWVWVGVAMGTAVLLRQLFLLCLPFIWLWAWVALRPKLAYLITPVIIVVALIVPWTIRNANVFGQFVLLNTNAGYAFYWGNHPIHGTHFIPILPPEMGSYYSLIPPDLLPLNEAAMDTALLKLALTGIKNDMPRYILLSLSRIPPYFEFWPTADSGMVSNLSRVGSFGLFLPFMLGGLVRSFRYKPAPWRAWLASPFFLLYLFMLIYTGIHVLTWTLIRYRLPIDAILVIFAALALVELGQVVTNKFAKN